MLLSKARLVLNEPPTDFANRFDATIDDFYNWRRGFALMPYEAIWFVLETLDLINERGKAHKFLNFNNLLKLMRGIYDETQIKFCKRFNYNRDTIRRWETGDNNMPYQAIWAILTGFKMLKK